MLVMNNSEIDNAISAKYSNYNTPLIPNLVLKYSWLNLDPDKVPKCYLLGVDNDNKEM